MIKTEINEGISLFNNKMMADDNNSLVAFDQDCKICTCLLFWEEVAMCFLQSNFKI